MATRTNSANSASTSREMADGFLNIRVTAKDGSVHSFKTGIALHSSRKLDAAILKNPQLFLTAMAEGRITASVWVPSKDGEGEIDL